MTTQCLSVLDWWWCRRVYMPERALIIQRCWQLRILTGGARKTKAGMGLFLIPSQNTCCCLLLSYAGLTVCLSCASGSMPKLDTINPLHMRPLGLNWMLIIMNWFVFVFLHSPAYECKCSGFGLKQEQIVHIFFLVLFVYVVSRGPEYVSKKRNYCLSLV